jgi:hypothetical protein
MEEEGWLKVGVAGALARQYAEHQRDFLETLSIMLERALPEQVHVKRRRVLFGKEQPVAELRLELGDEHYTLDAPKQGALRARRVLSKRGIVLRTEELSMQDWIVHVGDALEEFTQHHAEAATALRRFIE